MIRVVHVQWKDAASLGDWRSKKAVKEFIETELEVVHTVGMLIHEDENKVVLIQTKGANEVIGLFEIPKGCVQSVTELEVLPITIEL